MWFSLTSQWHGGRRLRQTKGGSTSFLLNSRGKALTSNGLSKFLLNKVYESTGKKVSANMLRHIFLSDMYKGETPLSEKKRIAQLMNHSLATAELIYTKKT